MGGGWDGWEAGPEGGGGGMMYGWRREGGGGGMIYGWRRALRLCVVCVKRDCNVFVVALCRAVATGAR